MAKSSVPRPKGRSRKSAEILHLGGSQVLPGIDRPSVVARARAADRQSDARVTEIDKGFRQIDRDLVECRQTLMCAVEALETADQLHGADELGAAAVNVTRRCSEQLFEIECAFDRLSLKYSQLKSVEAQP